MGKLQELHLSGAWRQVDIDGAEDRGRGERVRQEATQREGPEVRLGAALSRWASVSNHRAALLIGQTTWYSDLQSDRTAGNCPLYLPLLGVSRFSSFGQQSRCATVFHYGFHSTLSKDQRGWASLTNLIAIHIFIFGEVSRLETTVAWSREVGWMREMQSSFEGQLDGKMDRTWRMATGERML